MQITPPLGFSAASEGTYPARVDLVIPETVGLTFVVQVFDQKLRSPVSFSSEVTTLWAIRCAPVQRVLKMR